MRKPEKTDPDQSTRRRLVGTSAAMALASLGAAARADVAPQAFTIKRGRYGLTADFSPVYNTVTVVPWNVTYFQQGTDWTLQPDGKILINTTGLYRIIITIDWVAQAGTDIDLRIYGILCTRLAAQRRQRTPTPFHDDRLAWVDVPGSNPPKSARYQGRWAPGLIPMGGIVATEVTLANAGVVGIGDVAFASHTQISDAVIGPDAVNALGVQAKVVGPDRVRVCLYNPTIADGIVVPDGVLNVVAMNAVLTCGENDDAFQMLQTPIEQVKAGEIVYGVVRSHVRNDYLQANKDCFMQVERVG